MYILLSFFNSIGPLYIQVRPKVSRCGRGQDLLDLLDFQVFSQCFSSLSLVFSYNFPSAFLVLPQYFPSLLLIFSQSSPSSLLVFSQSSQSSQFHLFQQFTYGAKGCLQKKKKLHMEGHCPNLILPPPPPQKQGQRQKGHFLGSRPPSPP